MHVQIGGEVAIVACALESLPTGCRVMKTSSEATAEKLRGGFYTPTELVVHCFRRIRELVGDRSELALVEPAAGDGAFLRGLAASPLAEQIESVVAIELDEAESAAVRRALQGLQSARKQLILGSAVGWAGSEFKRV